MSNHNVLTFDSSGNAGFAGGSQYQGAVDPRYGNEFDDAGNLIFAENAGEIIPQGGQNPYMQGLKSFGGGVKDFFTGGSVTVGADGKPIQELSAFNKLMPAFNLANSIYQFRESTDLQEGIRRDNREQNQRDTLGRIASANVPLQGREFQRLKANGLSTDEARAGAKAYVAENGFTPEQFGVKRFGTGATSYNV